MEKNEILLGKEREIEVLKSKIRRLEDKLDTHMQPGLTRLSGLMTEKAFYRAVQSTLRKNADREYVIIRLDIEHFKLYNDRFGSDAGDTVLIKTGEFLRKQAEINQGFASYLGSDDFLIFLPDTPEGQMEKIIDLEELAAIGGPASGLQPLAGIYKISGSEIPVRDMCDRAAIALECSKGQYPVRFVWYDSSMKIRLAYEQKLIAEAKKSLENHDFILYAQPQCSLVTRKVVGAEVLIRWQHPERGLLMPGEFIPVFEKTGFITELDRYVWEEVCKFISRLTKKERRQYPPFSVNVSRLDVVRINDLSAVFLELVHAYNLKPGQLEIEITESVYAEDDGRVDKIIQCLRKNGFTVLMDDFGSGYSSLNMLKDIEFDILKIDMQFLNLSDTRRERGKIIVESIVTMAKKMGLRVIAEGVETRKQAESLMNMGCEYIQGYYCYRPFPIEEYTKHLPLRVLDADGIMTSERTLIRTAELLQSDLVSSEMMNNILGGFGCVCLVDERLELLQYNTEFFNKLGYSASALEKKRKNLLVFFNTDKQKEILKTLEQAKKNAPKGAGCVFEFTTMNGEHIWLYVRSYFVRQEGENAFFYQVLEDITSIKAHEKAFESQSAKLSFLNDRISCGIHQCASDRENTFLYVSRRFEEITGFTWDEIKNQFNNQYMQMVHPEDRERIYRSIHAAQSEKLFYEKYRIRTRDGYIQVVDQTRMVVENGEKTFFGVILDVSEKSKEEAGRQKESPGNTR